MEEAAKLTLCGFILHNLAIQHGFNGDDLDSIEDDEDIGHFFAEENGDRQGNQDPPHGTRRNQLLPFFRRQV